MATTRPHDINYLFEITQHAPDHIDALGERLFYLAERGDAAASAILDEMITPERIAKQAFLEEAIDWDQWTRDGAVFGPSDKSRFHDPDELVLGFARYQYITELAGEELDKRIAAGELESFEGEDGKTRYRAVESLGASKAEGEHE